MGAAALAPALMVAGGMAKGAAQGAQPGQAPQPVNFAAPPMPFVPAPQPTNYDPTANGWAVPLGGYGRQQQSPGGMSSNFYGG